MQIEKFLRATLSWAALIALFLFAEHIREPWPFSKLMLAVSMCLLAGAALSLVFLLIGKLLGRPRSAQDAGAIATAPQPETTSDKVIDFFATAVFLSLFNYYSLSKSCPVYKSLLISIIPAVIAAFILAMYRSRIKNWLKSKLKRAA